MPTSKCELALTRLCHARLLTGADKKAPIHELLEEFVRLAAAFAEALKHAGLSRQLRRRALKFEKLTAPGSPFDTARHDAEKTLSKFRVAPGLYLPEISAPRLPTKNLVPDLDEQGGWTGMFDCDWRHPEYLPTVAERWADRERTRWDLRTALTDVEAVLGLKLAASAQRAFEGWKRALWDINLLSERKHLFGSYLLTKCQVVRAPGANADDYQALLDRLEEAPVRLSREMKNAAEDIFHSGGPICQSPDPTPIPADKEIHAADEPLPPEFPHGPIAGTLKYLAELICPLYEKEPSGRALKLLCSRKSIWLQKISGQSYKVYFRDTDRSHFARVNVRDMEHKQQKQAEKVQKEAN
jgi:hypothetical protein